MLHGTGQTASVRTDFEKLSAYPKQNALALRAIGRIKRTLRTLDWIGDPRLRRETTEELNKGEAHNALAGAVAFHRPGPLPGSQSRKPCSSRRGAAALNLVTAATVLWNIRYLGRALEHLHQAGEHFDEQVLRRLSRSPLGWDHIDLTGGYVWSSDFVRGPDVVLSTRARSSIRELTRKLEAKQTEQRSANGDASFPDTASAPRLWSMACSARERSCPRGRRSWNGRRSGIRRSSACFCPTRPRTAGFTASFPGWDRSRTSSLWRLGVPFRPWHGRGSEPVARRNGRPSAPFSYCGPGIKSSR